MLISTTVKDSNLSRVPIFSFQMLWVAIRVYDVGITIVKATFFRVKGDISGPGQRPVVILRELHNLKGMNKIRVRYMDVFQLRTVHLDHKILQILACIWEMKVYERLRAGRTVRIRGGGVFGICNWFPWFPWLLPFYSVDFVLSALTILKKEYT
jgi:hypothetical protein